MDNIELTDADLDEMLKEMQRSYLYSLKFFLCELDLIFRSNMHSSEKYTFVIESYDNPTDEKKLLYRQEANGKNYFSN